MPKVRVLCSAGVTQPRRSYDPVRLPPWPLPSATLRTLPSPLTGLPRLPEPPFRRAVPTTPADRAGAHVDCFPRSLEPSPSGRWVGIRIVTFEACSGFTHVTARRIAQPPKATFVTRLQPSRLPSQAARQLPDLSTILRVESSSTGVSRLRGALPVSDLRRDGNKGGTCIRRRRSRSASADKTDRWTYVGTARKDSACQCIIVDPQVIFEQALEYRA